MFNRFRDLGHNQIGSYHVKSFITAHSWSYCKQLISMLLFLLAFDVLNIIIHYTLSVCSQPWRQWKRLEWFVDLQCRTTRSNLASLEHLLFFFNKWQNTTIFKQNQQVRLLVLAFTTEIFYFLEYICFICIWEISCMASASKRNFFLYCKPGKRLMYAFSLTVCKATP